jgi:hypothetical protein
VTAAALAAAAVTRVHDSAPKRPSAPASQKVGDSADMMRRLQRKSLLQRDR